MNHPKQRIIALAGGIGSGKSIIADMLRTMGYAVYDSDLRARAIVDREAALRHEIASQVDPEALRPDGTIDRQQLAKTVFASPHKLQVLNKLVHGAVKQDFVNWAEQQTGSQIFIETAILYQSGFDAMVDEVWEVAAPEQVRIARVMQRNGLSAPQVKDRIKAQRFMPSKGHPNVKMIVNDGKKAVLPQVVALLAESAD